MEQHVFSVSELNQLVKGLLDAVLCLLIYKPLSPILHGRK